MMMHNTIIIFNDNNHSTIHFIALDIWQRLKIEETVSIRNNKTSSNYLKKKPDHSRLKEK